MLEVRHRPARAPRFSGARADDYFTLRRAFEILSLVFGSKVADATLALFSMVELVEMMTLCTPRLVRARPVRPRGRYPACTRPRQPITSMP